MKVTVLIENTALSDVLSCEHGLSLYIETSEHRILFDAGQSGAFADNAEALGLDLAKVDIAILSHGHYDHSGGFARFLELNSNAKIYMNHHAAEPHFNAEGKYIGLDDGLLSCGRVTLTGDETCIDDSLSLFTGNPFERKFKFDTFGLTVEHESVRTADDFRHEQYLAVRENGKCVLFSGCSHKGVLNILEWCTPDVLVGGFHFMKLDTVRDADQLEASAKALLEYPTVYYTGHCTGETQFAFLKELMGSRLNAISSGTTFEV